MDGLTEKCLHILDKQLSEENVCRVLEDCHMFHDDEIEKKALAILTTSGPRLTTSSSFHELCHDCLKKYLQSDDLKMDEDEVFDAILSWTKEKCRKRKLKVTAENIKDMLGDLKFEIRFLDISHYSLLRNVRESGVLTNDERIAMLDRSACSDIDIAPFNSAERSGQLYTSVLRFFKQDFGWECCEGSEEEIDFTVDKDIELLGVYLYGSRNIKESHLITVKIEENDCDSFRNKTWLERCISSLNTSIYFGELDINSQNLTTLALLVRRSEC